MSEETLQDDLDAPLIVPDSDDDYDDQEEPKETKELVAKGSIKKSLYWKYLKANRSIFLLLFTVFLCVIAQLACSGSDYWIAYW